MFFKPKLSCSCIRPCLSLCPDIPMMVWILTIYFENRQSFPFVLRVCKTSFFFDFVIPVFCLNCFFLYLQSARCPSFVSLLHRFWLIGLLFLRNDDCLSFWLFGTIIVFCFKRTCFDVIRYALGLTERTTLPQVMIKGFNFWKEKLLVLWLEGVDEGLSSL